MAAPSAPNVYIGGNHKWGSDGVAAITTTPSESVTKVTAIISQTSGGAAIETVETSTKTSSDQFADRWALTWPTTGITSSPYYVRVRSTNADGNGPFKEIAPYIYFPPTVSVTAPANGSTLTSASVTMAWTASDPYGISAQRVTVLHGADVLLDEAVGESDTSYAVPSSVAFLDGESYTFRVTARNGNGMEASADSTCAFSFDAPAAASVTITDDGATATIAVDDPHYSESGSTISVDGSAIADSFTVFGNSTQDGTPTPSAPVAIESVESQNLQPFFSQDFSDTSYWFYPPFTSGGVSTDTTPTATQLSEGWAHVEWGGTVSRRQLTATTPVMPTDGSIKPSSTYTLMVEVRNYSATGTNAQMVFPATDGTKAPWTTNSYQGALSDGMFLYTASTKADISAATQLRCFMVACNGVSTSTTFSLSFDIRMSLYEGTYHGRYMPAGAIQVTSMSRNRFDSSMLTRLNGTEVTVSDGDVTVTATSASLWSYAYASFPAKEGETYTLSATVSGSSSQISLIFNDEIDFSTFLWGSSSTSTGSTSITGTAPSGTNYVQVFLYARRTGAGAVGDSATYGKVQLEIGSPATAYRPYSSTTYPIDLQGHALRSLPDGTHDELRVEGGNAVLVKRVGRIVLDGSETFYMTTSGYQTYFDHVDSTAPLVYGATTFDKRPYTMSNITTDARNPDNPSVSDASIWVYAFTSDTQGIRIRLGGGVISSQTSVAALQQWLAATNVEILYKLATPQEIDLGAASDYPFIPDDGEMWVDGTEMEAVLRPADYAGQPPISSVDIARVNPDGTWTLAQGVTEGQSAIDPLPPLGVAYRYALTSHAAGGGTKVAYAEHTVETRAWHLNFGDAAQEHVSYLYNPQATMTLAQGGESYHFADGGAGRGLPVFYPTTDRDMSGTLKFDTVLYGDSDILLDLCDRYPVAWLRDPFGHRWRAHVRPSVSHGVGQVWPVTIAWDAVRFEEV